MSDQDKNPPSEQTSSVPLKKETVRITLKANQTPSAPAPPSAPTPPPAPTPLSKDTGVVPPSPPPAPAAPKPVAGPPKVGGAPTIPLRKPAAGAGAPRTVALKTGAAAPAQPGAPLPQATKRLDQTQPLGKAPAAAAATASFADEEDEEETEGAAYLVAAVIVFCLSAAVLGLEVVNYLAAGS
ncbi:MAG: hypothetical protein AAF555_01205 [Verrucomicrobiota bacterium]